MANSAEILDSLKELRKDNREDHRELDAQLKEMNGTQRRHTLEIRAIESVQATHEGMIAIGATERKDIKLSVQNISAMSTKKLVAVIGAASTLAYAVLEIIKHLTAGGAP